MSTLYWRGCALAQAAHDLAALALMLPAVVRAPAGASSTGGNGMVVGPGGSGGGGGWLASGTGAGGAGAASASAPDSVSYKREAGLAGCLCAEDWGLVFGTGLTRLAP